MTDSLHLTPEELHRITGRKQSRKQQEVLAQMGIQFRVNADGDVLVVREHYTGVTTRSKKTVPNFGAIAIAKGKAA